MQVIEGFKGLCISLLRSLNGFRFRKPFVVVLSCVGQVAFSGRNQWDAA